MPKSLSEYTWSDWCRLRPLTHTAKTVRYRRIDQRYLCSPADLQRLHPIRIAMRRRPVVVTIAFNDDQVIAWQIPLVAEFMPHATHVIIDNSSCSDAADRIGHVCRSAGTHYVRLDANPWSHRNPSRSHGLAMNWVWRHLLRPAQPTAFGFIDHDLFPVAPTDPFQEVEQRICWGDKRWAGDRWFLWAGFCFFSFRRVARLPLDFGLDWFLGLDTGGANWQVLYRHVDPKTLPDRQIVAVAALPDASIEDAYFERRGHWIHEVGLAGDSALRPRKRLALRDLLEPAVL